MLFDLVADPHEQNDLANECSDLVDRAMGMLAGWHHQMMVSSRYDVDPMMTVLRNGGPFHTRGQLPGYLDRLRATGRSHYVQRLLDRHPDEASSS